MRHIRGSSENVVLRGVKEGLYSEEDRSWQVWSTYVKRREIILIKKFRKAACGCRIVALGGCSVYNSDMGLRQRISVSAP